MLQCLGLFVMAKHYSVSWYWQVAPIPKQDSSQCAGLPVNCLSPIPAIARTAVSQVQKLIVTREYQLPLFQCHK
jgi:hypothetical protein